MNLPLTQYWILLRRWLAGKLLSNLKPSLLRYSIKNMTNTEFYKSLQYLVRHLPVCQPDHSHKAIGWTTQHWPPQYATITKLTSGVCILGIRQVSTVCALSFFFIFNHSICHLLHTMKPYQDINLHVKISYLDTIKPLKVLITVYQICSCTSHFFTTKYHEMFLNDIAVLIVINHIDHDSYL